MVLDCDWSTLPEISDIPDKNMRNKINNQFEQFKMAKYYGAI